MAQQLRNRGYKVEFSKNNQSQVPHCVRITAEGYMAVVPGNPNAPSRTSRPSSCPAG